MDERLKELMKELGYAINESLSDSERIAAAIGEIKRAGYDVFLVLEATIGFNKRDEPEEEEGDVVDVQTIPASDKIRWSSQDSKFLKALKIAVEGDESDETTTTE